MVLYVGLSPRIMDALNGRKPVSVLTGYPASEFPEGWEIFLLAYDTKEQMRQTLTQAGLIHAGAEIHKLPDPQVIHPHPDRERRKKAA